MSIDPEDLDNQKLDMLANGVFDELVEDVTIGLCHQTHRAAKLGYLMLEETAIEEEKKYRIVDKKGFDVFGESSNQAKKQYECTCPNCERTLAAQRFAPHLEKCMGMGRNSSRIASKRITASTNSSKTNAVAVAGDSDLEDNDKSSDNDWNEKTAVKKSRKKKNNVNNGVSAKRIASKKGSHHSAASSTVTSVNGLRSGDSSLIETRSEYQF